MGRIKPKRLAKIMAKQAKKERARQEFEAEERAMFDRIRALPQYATMNLELAGATLAGGLRTDDGGMPTWISAWLWLKDHGGVDQAVLDKAMDEASEFTDFMGAIGLLD